MCAGHQLRAREHLLSTSKSRCYLPMSCARCMSLPRWGAERLSEIMSELINRSAAVVRRYGGTLDKFTGDGVMAVFGAPTALEDHALRGCLAALGIQDEAKRLADEVGQQDGVDLNCASASIRV